MNVKRKITKLDFSKLSTIKRKIIGNIFEPVYNMETETYERTHNKDLQNLYLRPNILSYCKRKIIDKAGHVWRAKGKIIKCVTDGNVVRKRSIPKKTQNKMERCYGKRNKNNP